jgi:hypothetical protein
VWSHRVSRLFRFDGRLVQYGGFSNPARRLTLIVGRLALPPKAGEVSLTDTAERGTEQLTEAAQPPLYTALLSAVFAFPPFAPNFPSLKRKQTLDKVLAHDIIIIIENWTRGGM